MYRLKTEYKLDGNVCRFFGCISVEPIDVKKYLLTDPCSIFIQSKTDSRRLQKDGWGIGYYGEEGLYLIKSEIPIYEEQRKFYSTLTKAKSRIIISHIRKASNPKMIPRTQLISTENSQPFKYENYLFAHNGTLMIPDEVTASLGDWKHKIKGFNDSEVYFWFIIKQINEGATFPSAIEEFEKNTIRLWKTCRSKHPNARHPYYGLNTLISDGKILYAYCRYNDDEKTMQSLCFGDKPVFQMSYFITPKRLVIASERTNNKDSWQTLENGQLLIGKIQKNHVVVDLKVFR